jgi:hypothetical protein
MNYIGPKALERAIGGLEAEIREDDDNPKASSLTKTGIDASPHHHQDSPESPKQG